MCHNHNQVISIWTWLALASILGPFGVHLLKFTLNTHPSSLMHHLGLLEFPVRICDALVTHQNTHETYLIYPMSMLVISSLDFLLFSCLHVRLRNALRYITKCMTSTVIIWNFGRLRTILWNVFKIYLASSTSHANANVYGMRYVT